MTARDAGRSAPADTKALAYSVLTDAQKKRFEETPSSTSRSASAASARFRCNVFNQRGAVGAVFRLIPDKIRTFEELGLPPVIAKLAERPRGLVLVTGPTGSGKSTTLAAMIDKINTERHEPHPHDRGSDRVPAPRTRTCLVNQREVHADTQSFTNALRAALREDPDVVLIGEMRDLETDRGRADDRRDRPPHVRHAAHQLRGADDQPHHRRVPGAPAVAGPHAAVARARGHRLPDAAAEGQRAGPRASRSRSWCPTPAIRNLIREDKVHQIYSAMQTGQEKVGMQTMNQSLASLYFKQADHARDGDGASSSLRDELQEMINRGVGVVPGAGLGRPAACSRGR